MAGKRLLRQRPGQQIQRPEVASVPGGDSLRERDGLLGGWRADRLAGESGAASRAEVLQRFTRRVHASPPRAVLFSAQSLAGIRPALLVSGACL
jgi:hypothetical protein